MLCAERDSLRQKRWVAVRNFREAIRTLVVLVENSRTDSDFDLAHLRVGATDDQGILSGADDTVWRAVVADSDLLLAYVTGMVNQRLLLQNEYLIAENRIRAAGLFKREEPIVRKHL